MSRVELGPPRITIAWASVEVAGGDTRLERRAVAWELVRRLAGPQVELANPCPRCGGPHGPVQVTGAAVLASVTYATTPSGVVAVVGLVDRTDAAAFGLDAETSSRAIGDALGRPATARDWVRVESALKADGRGLRVDPGTVTLDTGEGDFTAWVPGRRRPLRGIDVAGPTGILISAAYEPPAGRATPLGPATG